MATFAYTKIPDGVLDQILGFTTFNTLKNSVRYLGEDILGDPAANGDDVSLPADLDVTGEIDFGTITADAANESFETYTRPTGSTVAVRGVGISGNVLFSTSSGTLTDVTNASIQITTTGRPVLIIFVPATTGTNYFGVDYTAGASEGNLQFTQTIALIRGSTQIARTTNQGKFRTNSSGDLRFYVPCGALTFLDAVSAGTYEWKLQTSIDFGNSDFVGRLIGFEL